MKTRETFRNVPPLPLWIILAVLPMFATFGFSSQDAAHSGSLSELVLNWLLRSFPFLHGLGSVAQLHTAIRKLAHFSLYFILGCGLRGLSTYQQRFPAVPLVLAAGIAQAALDEFHQRFTPGRGPSLIDVGIDTLGAATGCAVISLLFFLLRERLSRTS